MLKRTLGGCLLFVVIIFLYIYGAYLNARTVNTSWLITDQSAYLTISRQIIQTKFNYLSDGSRMPLYPIMLIPLFNENYLVFFARAKIFNIILSVVYLGILYLFFRKHLSLAATINLILICAFTFFIFKAPYVQPELTFFMLFFFSFVTLIEFIRKPSVKIAMLAGFLTSLTYLAKTSTMPLIVTFIIVFLLKFRKNLIQFKYLFLFLTVLFLVISPLLYFNKKNFCSYFFNVEYYYAWYDNWDQCLSGPLSLEKDVNFCQLDKQDLPGLQKYFQTHSWQQAFNRLVDGFMTTVNHILYWHAYGYFSYLLAFSFFLVILSILTFKKIQKMWQKISYQFIFLLITVLLYTVLFSWETPITLANRYPMTLFLPFMFFIYKMIEKLTKFLDHGRNRLLSLSLNYGFNRILLVVICYNIFITIFFRIGYLRGGN